MASELNTLVWVPALQLVMWIPYILNVVMVRGHGRYRAAALVAH